MYHYPSAGFIPNIHPTPHPTGLPVYPQPDFSHIAWPTLPPRPPNPVRYFPSHRYVAGAVIIVYIGTIQINNTLERVPMVARVSITDYRGNTLLDTYVRPTHVVVDYRTAQTGLRAAHLDDAPEFDVVQRRVADIIRNKILVGHTLWNFLSVLGLSHVALDTRDLALFRPMRKKLKSRVVVELPTLAKLFMGRNVGLEYEDPLETARAALDLFRSCEGLFERVIHDGAWPYDLPPSSFAVYYE